MADAFSLRRDRDMRLDPGAVALLVHLREAGYQLALLTNGASPLHRAKLERFGLMSCFHIEGEVGVGKPDPAAFRRMFDVLAVGPAAVCVIGDGLEWDIHPSMALGCRTILYDPDTLTGDEFGHGETDIVARNLASLAARLPGPRVHRP
ncbi:MAG: HAD family hydrolase [Brevundimonas sp.]